MRFLSNLTHADLVGKKCLLRTNLDIREPRANSLRIIKALPTIQFLLDRGAKPIIISHRGRPGNRRIGKIRESEKSDDGKKIFSLKPCIDLLEQKIRRKLEWRENLRFDPREEKNDMEFARMLAGGADMYINDDFATSHHIAASLVAITQFLPSYVGLLLEKEIQNLSAIRDNYKQPLVVIIGGIKIEDKLGALYGLRIIADSFLLGSAYGAAREALPRHPRIFLPQDSKKYQGKPMDIGVKTIKEYAHIIARAKTIIWNGPLGNIENPPYDKGSAAIAEAITKSNAFSVVGGGDTINFLTRRTLIKKFNFVSTGGGAMLQFLGNKPMPALLALDKCPFV